MRAQLRDLGVKMGSNVLAATAVDLAKRLDAGPGDRNAVDLAHELRMTLLELRRQADSGGASNVERFLDRIAAPDLGNSAN